MTTRHGRTRSRLSIVPLIWAALVIAGLPALGRAQTTAAPAAGQSEVPPGGFGHLIAGLKATPGCLGVDTAQTSSGKRVIFAWFEDKKALLRWYGSDTHQQTMAMFFPGRTPGRTPLAQVPDDSGPILAIASLKMADAPASGAMPFAQIAIELYRPLGGGIAVGGKFAPDALKVPGLVEIGRPTGAK